MSKEPRAIKLAKALREYLFEEEYDELKKLNSSDRENLKTKIREVISILVKIK